MLRVNFACYFYLEAVLSFELIWTSLNDGHSLQWIPILLHYIGLVLKLILNLKRHYSLLWILSIGNDAAALGLLKISSSNIGYLYVIILVQFQLLYETQYYYKHSILLIIWAMISQMLLNYQDMWRMLLIFGECSALFCFLYFVNRSLNKEHSDKMPLDQSLKQDVLPTTKQHILRLMPWLSDQKFLVLSDNFCCLYDQSDLKSLMEQDDINEAINFLLENKCETLSANLIRLLQENNTNILSQNFRPYQLRPDVKVILNAMLSDMNSYYSYFYVTDVDNKNFQNLKLNFFILSNNFIDYVVIHFETLLKPSLKSVYTFPENNKVSNTNYNQSNNSKQTHETISSELLGNIFQSISHEFGTFLNCILTVTSEGMENEIINEQIKATYIQPSYINAKLLSYVLQNVRDFNTILLKQFALRLQEFSPLEIINEIQYLLNQQTTQRNNSIVIHCPINLLVYNDSQRFKQVVYQIVSNSIRFTENGIIRITIKNNKDKIKVSVTDNGIGMTPAEQLNLRKLLQDNKKLLRVSHNSVGCGLGLSISNAIVLKMNGKRGIQFTSEQNRGSKFFFTISNSFQLYNDSVYVASQTFVKVLNQTYYLEQQPGSDGPRNSLSREDETMRGQRLFSNSRFAFPQNQKVHIEEDEIESRSEESNIMIPSLQASLKSEIVKFSISSNCCNRVLIVDDEYFNIQSLQLILNRFNAHCDFTFNGQQAVKRCLQKLREPCNHCHSNGYVVYFLDLNMPIMDGFDTVKELKKMMHLNIIPKGICIANTGYADLESKQMALKAGMDFYMTKPIIIKELEIFIKRKFP